MNTRQLRYLVTVARIGNLSHAAGHLGISQPALSKLIRTWEETYGFPLFLRFGHKLAPTAIGRLYLDYAQRILDEQNRMILTMPEHSAMYCAEQGFDHLQRDLSPLCACIPRHRAESYRAVCAEPALHNPSRKSRSGAGCRTCFNRGGRHTVRKR